MCVGEVAFYGGKVRGAFGTVVGKSELERLTSSGLGRAVLT